MIRIIAVALFACVAAAAGPAAAQCGNAYDQMVAEARATRESLDAIERYAPADGPARVTSSLVTRARATARSVDRALEYGVGRPRYRGRDSSWEEDWYAHLGQLNADLDAFMPRLRVSAQLSPAERAELRRIVTGIAVTGCRP